MDQLTQMRLIPGDLRLIDEIMFELKSKGIFDTFRKDCIADVDTRPAYQNLRQRVESSVHNFLSRQTWVPEMNKNQMREKLRKHIMDGNYLEQGVERIVDQVVNPKVNTIFKPEVEDLVYNYYGVPRPKKLEEDVVDLTENLLPQDLEAVSPGSVTNEEKEMDVTIEEDSKTEKMDEDKENINTPEDEKSPTFEPVCNSQGIHLPDESEPLPGIIDLTLNDVDSIENPMDIPLPGEDVKVEDIPSPDSTPPDVNVQNIQLPEESSAVEIYNIPLPDDLPPEVPENTDEYHFKPIESDDESISSSDSSLRRNMSPLTPIRNFDNDNSYDAQQAFESTDSPEKKDECKVDPIVPISTFRFTIESKDSESSSDGIMKTKKTLEMSSYKTGNEIKTFSSPLLQSYGDSSNSNNLHIDYESDNSKVINDLKIIEGDQNSESTDISKKETKSEDKRSSHKSSHSSRDKHRDRKDKRSDSKHSSSRDKKDSKTEKKSSRDDSKSKSHRDSSKDSDRKDSKSKDYSRHTSSHRSSNNKEKSSSHRHSSSSTKQPDERKSSSNKDKSDKHSESRTSKDSSKSSRDHKSKDRKSSSSRSKTSDEKEKKEKKSLDDHYSLSGRGNTSRRSTDRDSNDGNSSSSKGSNINSSSKTTIDKTESKSSSKSGSTSSSSETTVQSDSVAPTNKHEAVIKEMPPTIPPVIRIDSHLGVPICEAPQVIYEEEVKIRKPKFAPNFEEAKRLMKLRDIMNAEERKKKQDAALLLEFQQNVRPSLSQVYSSIPGPELEFACSANSNNYTVQVNVEPIMENVSNEAIEENYTNELNDQVMEQKVEISPLNTLVKAMIEVQGVAGSSEDSVDEIEIKLDNDSKPETYKIIDEWSEDEDLLLDNKEVKAELIVNDAYEEIKDYNIPDDNKIKDETLEIVPESDSKNEFHYFSEIDKFVAEIERDTFSIFLKELSDTIEHKTKLYLINCDEYTKEVVEEMSASLGEYEIVNYCRNGKLGKSKTAPVDIVISNTEIVIPVEKEKVDLFSPVKCEEIDYDREKDKLKSEVKTKQEIMEIIFGVPSDSPSRIPNVKLGDECLIWNDGSRGVKRKLSLEHDNNNMDVLSPIKIHTNNDCEDVTSTETDTEVRTSISKSVNNAHAKYIGRAQRVGLPKPKRISLAISPSSVENYENTPKTPEPVENGKMKPKKSYIQRYERSDLYKPKLHYLSRRNMT